MVHGWLSHDTSMQTRREREGMERRRDYESDTVREQISTRSIRLPHLPRVRRDLACSVRAFVYEGRARAADWKS